MKKILLALMLCMVSVSGFAETIDTISVKQAISIASSLRYNTYSQKEYAVIGYVKKIKDDYSNIYKNQSLLITDNEYFIQSPDYDLICYHCSVDSPGCEVNDHIVVTGKLYHSYYEEKQYFEINRGNISKIYEPEPVRYTHKFDYDSDSIIELYHYRLKDTLLFDFDYRTFISTALNLDSIDFFCYSVDKVNFEFDSAAYPIIVEGCLRLNEILCSSIVYNTNIFDHSCESSIILKDIGYDYYHGDYFYYKIYNGLGVIPSNIDKNEFYSKRDYEPLHARITISSERNSFVGFSVTIPTTGYIIPKEGNCISFTINKKFNFRIYINDQEENPTTEINNVNSNNENTKQIKNGVFVIGTDNGDYNTLGNLIKK